MKIDDAFLAGDGTFAPTLQVMLWDGSEAGDGSMSYLFTEADLLQLLADYRAGLKAYRSMVAVESGRKDRLIGIDELAAKTGKSVSQIYQMTAARSIPFYKFGKNILFDFDEVKSSMTHCVVKK